MAPGETADYTLEIAIADPDSGTDGG